MMDVFSMKKFFYTVLSLAALWGCAPSGQQFEVEGKVSGADGKMLYLEAVSLDGIHAIDSVKLKGDGDYQLRGSRPGAPEFYRLRLEDKVIHFSVDSTETITLNAPYEGFATGYQVSGSVSSEKIKELDLKLARLQTSVDALTKQVQSGTIPAGVYEDSVAALVTRYKEDVKLNYIYQAPNMPYAYHALFQRVNGYFLFDPMNSRDDVKCFAAVATSLNSFYPDADRSKNLYNIVIKGMRNTRQVTPAEPQLPVAEVSEAGLIDFGLKDMKGVERRPSQLKGKVVLIDFTIYQSAVSTSHNYTLRDLYTKYHEQGLEIYQVSLDADEHYWKTVADNLPWICVRDENGVYSPLLNTYNVRNVPTLFLVNRNNELRARTETIRDLETAVKELL